VARTPRSRRDRPLSTLNAVRAGPLRGRRCLSLLQRPRALDLVAHIEPFERTVPDIEVDRPGEGSDPRDIHDAAAGQLRRGSMFPRQATSSPGRRRLLRWADVRKPQGINRPRATKTANLARDSRLSASATSPPGGPRTAEPDPERKNDLRESRGRRPGK
jgi:hypothetical protein